MKIKITETVYCPKSSDTSPIIVTDRCYPCEWWYGYSYGYVDCAYNKEEPE